MTRLLSKTISLTAATFAITMLAGAAIPGAVTTAEAGVKHPRAHRLMHHLNHRHFYGPRFVVVRGYGGGGGCYWLKRRAVFTGLPYWWKRYNECIGE
jgi:hypothetical protein